MGADRFGRTNGKALDLWAHTHILFFGIVSVKEEAESEDDVDCYQNVLLHYDVV